MITSGYLATLEGWLGEGQLTLTNIFTKNSSDTTKDDPIDWHAAVDGKGRTFSVFQVTTSNGAGGNDNFILGGYDPVSWNGSLNDYILNPTDSGRTAFIFNLSTGIVLRQCKLTDNAACGVDSDGNSGGMFQTYNNINYGPTWGGGHDLNVGYNGTLNAGYDYAYSYGNPSGDLGCCARSLLDSDNSTYMWASVGALETFHIDPFTAVTEPISLALLGVGFFGLGLSKRKKR